MPHERSLGKLGIVRPLACLLSSFIDFEIQISLSHLRLILTLSFTDSTFKGSTREEGMLSGDFPNIVNKISLDPMRIRLWVGDRTGRRSSV